MTPTANVETTDYLSSLLDHVLSSGAARVVLEMAGVRLFAADGALLQTLPLSPEIHHTLHPHLSDRTFLWPDIGDNLFASNTKKRRLYRALECGKPLLSTLSFETKGKEPPRITLDEFSTTEPELLTDRLLLRDNNKRPLKQLAQDRSGLVLVNSIGKPLIIEAPAIALALCPNALYVRNVSNRKTAEWVLNKARERVVVAAVNSSDPVEMLLEFRSLLEAADEWEERLIALFRLSFVHRRVRRVCGTCARTSAVTAATLAKVPHFLIPGEGASYMFGRGCDRCGHSAYRGTIGLNSLLYASDEIREQLRAKAGVGKLTEIAYRQGTRALLEDGLERILGGFTSFEEVLAVAPRPSAAFETTITNHRLAVSANSDRRDRFDDALRSAGQDLFAEPKPQVVLLVEDDVDQLEILRLIFQAEGYRPICAAGGREALAVIEKSHVDIVVCDLMMPGLDGQEVVRRIRVNPKLRELPILILTALENDDREHAALSNGADDYCSKNVKRKVLLKRVEKLLERHKDRITKTTFPD